MPYFIWDESPECSGWAVVKEDGELMSCHKDKQSAIEAMVGVSAAEGIEPGGSYEEEHDEEIEVEETELREVNLTPPAYMRAAARQGLRYYEEGKAGDGVVDATIREARAMAAGNVTADKWVRIRAWISRHLVDLDSAAARPDSPD